MFKDMPRDLEGFARALAGNWRKRQNFYWERARDVDAHDWAIVYTHNRDSRLAELSNAAAIAKDLGKPEFADDVREESHSHWAVGHVDGFSVRVYRDGKITPVVSTLLDIAKRLDDYPLLDSDDHSVRELCATAENIEEIGRCMVKDDAPEGWAVEVMAKLPDAEIESTDDQGGYPSKEAVKEALASLGYLAAEDE